MTRWSLDQIRQVRGLRARAEVDVMTADRHPEALIEVRRKLAESLIRMAHPFAVEAHLADFQFSQRAGDDNQFVVEVRCWWEPDVKTIEILGGHDDGTVYEVAHPGDPIRLMPAPPSLMYHGEYPIEPLPQPIVAEMTGWDETNRRWVYEIQ